MANIVDELVLQLGLDASKFDKAQKKTIDNLRKMEDIQRKNSKENEKRLKETTEGYRQLRDAVVSFGTALIGVNGIKDLVSGTVGNETSLWRSSKMLGMHTRLLEAYGGAAKSFGGSQQGVLSTLQNLEGGFAKFQLEGNSPFMVAMARLGLKQGDFKNFTAMSRDITEASKTLPGGVQGAWHYAQQMGIDKGTFMLLMQGPGKVQSLVEQMYQASDATRRNVRESQKLYEKWVLLEQQGKGVQEMIVADLAPALGVLETGAQALLKDFRALDGATDGWTGKIVALGVAIMALRAPFTMLKSAAALLGKGGAAAEGGAAAGEVGLLEKSLGWLGVAGRMGIVGLLANAGLDIADPKDKMGSWIDQHIWGASWIDNEASRIGLGRSYAQQRAAAGAMGAQGVPGSTDAQGSPGSLPRGIRNNNPGNIRYGKFARAHGATGADAGGFAIFPTMAAGERAMADLLQVYRSQGRDTIAAIVSKWAPNSENDTAAYIASVSKQTGIGANSALSGSQYAMVQRAMMIQENGGAYARMLGPRARGPVVASGGTQVETHIGTIHVNAPNATDANGVARGMRSALQTNTLISGGMVGLT